MSDRKVKPSALFYVLGGVIALVGVVLSVLLLIQGVSDLSESLTQVVVPGTSEIELSEPGTYTIFHEYNSVVNGKVYRMGRNIANLQCTLISSDTGVQIPLSPPWGSTTYDMGSRKGYSLFKFSIDRPGTYELSASYSEGTGGPEAVLAVGHGFLGKLVRTILGVIVILFGSLIVGALVIVLTALKRHKAKKRLSYA